MDVRAPASVTVLVLLGECGRTNFFPAVLNGSS
jgi:hypothetical protein